MSVELTLTISEDVYEKVQHLAQARRLAVTDVVVYALNDLLLTADAERTAPDWAEPDEAVEREMQAYIAMHDRLKKQYLGKYLGPPS